MSAEAEILRRYRTIAVVGLSSDETRDSYSVSKYMQDAGYRIIPVHPTASEVLGEKAHPTVAAAGASVIWMQEGIVHEEAAARAREAGLEVVMDRCIRSAHRRLRAEPE